MTVTKDQSNGPYIQYWTPLTGVTKVILGRKSSQHQRISPDEDMCYLSEIQGMFEFSSGADSLFKFILTLKSWKYVTFCDNLTTDDAKT